jgi:serine/threonine protein kinase
MALQRETTRAQSLNSENIVRVHDFDYDGQYAYMTMELLDGTTLEDWLQEETSAAAPLDRRWSIVNGVGTGLACAHKNGVVHSDLKPGNIFLCKNGGIKVMDFGIARPLRAFADEADTTRFDAAERLGALTPAYASLEQLNYESPDPRDDIYAFACVVYYIYSGRHPFGRESAKRALETHIVPQRIPSLTRLQWETLRRGLAFKRSERIASINEFLLHFKPRTWWHKHRTLVGAAAVAVVGAGLFFGTQYYNDYVEDQAVNAQLWPGADGSAPQLTSEQRRDIDDFLYLSKEALRQAAGAKSPEEMSAILSKGDNNLLDLLKRVRGLEPANAQAVQMTDDATRLYASKVRTLLATQKPEEAMRLLREGQTFRHTLELFRLRRQICGSNPAACGISQ